MGTLATKRPAVAISSLNELAKLAASALRGHPETVPAGWHTAEEIAAQVGVSPAHARKAIYKIKAEGLVESRKFRIQCGERVLPVPHYRKILRA